jgi:hypothetical protein
MNKSKPVEYVKRFIGADGLQHQSYKGEEHVQCPDCGVYILIQNFPQPHQGECDGPKGRAIREKATRSASEAFNKIMRGGSNP